MVCLENIFASPAASGLLTAVCVLVYIMLMSYSPYLPPAVFLSIGAGLLVYFMKGGILFCSQLETEDTCKRSFRSK